MRRGIGLVIAASALMFASRSYALQDTGKSLDNFTFLCVTDTHQTASGSTDPLHTLVQNAIAMTPRPAFIIDTGDITEAGRPAEYARFKEAIAGLDAAGIKFYAVPGNHDVRWSPEGKEGFEKQFGKLYQSFDYGSAHFVLLDTTVVLEHWGHLDQAELDWLTRDLKRVKPETPIYLFMHHWIGRDAPSVRPIDNEFALWPILQNHNIAAIFTGHGHSDLVWKTNGITTLMSRGLYQGSYYRVAMTPLLASIDRFVQEKPGVPISIASLPLTHKAKPSVFRVAWDDPDVPYLERRRPAATLQPRAVQDNPDKETAKYRVDDGEWKAMTKDARDVWRDTFPTRSVPVGMHSADVRLTTSNDVVYDDELIFEVERDEKEPTRRWAINLQGPIQSSPLLVGNLLFVSSLDDHVVALETLKGKRRWTFAAKAPFLASPVAANGTLYIGSTDHFLYALDAESGRLKWKYDMESPIFATAAVAKGVVCLGGNQKIVGLNAENGSLKWTQPAGSFFQSRAATDGNNFYLGGWDNTFYALDAETGTPKWKAPMGRTNGGTGDLSFYYSPAIASPSLAKDAVFICSNDGVLHAVSIATGAELWSVQAPKGGDTLGYSSPVVAGTSVYVGGLGPDGDVYALDAATGRLLWRTPTGQTIYDSSPRLAPDGKSLAIMGVRGNVAVLETASGKRLWSYNLGPGNIFSTPEYDGQTVYTTTMENDVQALNAPAGGTATTPSSVSRGREQEKGDGPPVKGGR